MQSFLAVLIPILAMFIPIVLAIIGLKLYFRFEQRKPVRRPFTQPFMRLPGQSLRDQTTSVPGLESRIIEMLTRCNHRTVGVSKLCGSEVMMFQSKV